MEANIGDVEFSEEEILVALATVLVADLTKRNILENGNESSRGHNNFSGFFFKSKINGKCNLFFNQIIIKTH